MSKLGLALVSVALGLVVTTCSFAQTDTTNDVSLGELARTLRQRKTPVVQTVIDNDNMSKIMDQVEAHRQAGSLMFSFDNAGKTFHVSSPDVTWLYHLKAAAAPFKTTVLKETLGATLGSDQDWHWAIVQAKGVPPTLKDPPPTTPAVTP